MEAHPHAQHPLAIPSIPSPRHRFPFEIISILASLSFIHLSLPQSFAIVWCLHSPDFPVQRIIWFLQHASPVPCVLRIRRFHSSPITFLSRLRRSPFLPDSCPSCTLRCVSWGEREHRLTIRIMIRALHALILFRRWFVFFRLHWYPRLPLPPFSRPVPVFYSLPQNC
jgi:hypothetical protein